MSTDVDLPSPTDLADVWLGQAVTHAIAACDPAGGPDDGVAAFLHRFREARLSVLHSALAAEAALNGYVHACGPGYRTALGRLTPAERYSVAPKLLSGSTLFTPGSRLAELLVELFALREALVHAGALTSLDRDARAKFTPRAALDLLDASARACKLLRELTGVRWTATAETALRTATALHDRAVALADLPAPDDAAIEEARRSIAPSFPEELIVGA